MAVLALDGVIAFDLGIACEVFSWVRLPDGTHAYRVRVCGERLSVRASAFDLRVAGRLNEVAAADTVVVPGIEDVDAPIAPAVIASLQAAWDRGARVVSICTGAFVLGAAGCSTAGAPPPIGSPPATLRAAIRRRSSNPTCCMSIRAVW